METSAPSAPEPDQPVPTEPHAPADAPPPAAITARDPGVPGSQSAGASPRTASPAKDEAAGQRGDPPASAAIDAIQPDQAPPAAAAAAAGKPSLRPTDERSKAANASKPAIAPAPNTARNGFVSGEPLAATPDLAALDQLLNRMRHQTHKDGSVLYFIDNQPAFIDHGNQLLMVGAADHQEHAIVAAIAVAREKFGGAFEITGDAEFCRRTTAIMLKYELDVRLKNPEQEAMRRELARTQPAGTHRPATPSNPVAPIEPASLRPRAPRAADTTGDGATADAPELKPPAGPTADQSADQKAAAVPAAAAAPVGPAPGTSPTPSEPINRLAGKVLAHGHAPFNHVAGNSASYFVELENADGLTRTTWGVDLARVADKTGVNTGDQVVLQNLGKKPVEVQQTMVGADGKVSMSPIKAHRVIWDIEVTSRAGIQKKKKETPPPNADKPARRPGKERDSAKRAPAAKKAATVARQATQDSSPPLAASPIATPRAPRQRKARMPG